MNKNELRKRPPCPRCQQEGPIRYGHILNRQRWQCRGCRYEFTGTRLVHKPNELKWWAVELYEAGLSSNRIAQEVGLSPTTVLLWCRLLTPPGGRIHQMKVRWDKVLPPHIRAELRVIQNDLRQLAIQLKQFDKDKRIFTSPSS